MKNFIMFSLLVIVLSGCPGCQERYRYACQDPANWKKVDCSHPTCEVDGQCSDTLTDGVSEKILASGQGKIERSQEQKEPLE